jgi:hypothetical protein
VRPAEGGRHPEGEKNPTLAPLATVATVLVVVGVAWALRSAEGTRAVADCDAAFARGDRLEAVRFARAAAQARCPGCSAPELGYARLEAIARNAEGRGDDATAVAAWRAVRSAALGTLVFDARPAWRERADPEIARFEHRREQARIAGGDPPAAAATEERLRAALEPTPVPSGGLFALLAAGGALFAIGAVRFVRTPTFSATAALVALAGAAVAVVGLVAF